MLLIIAISTFVCISLAMMGAYWLLYRPQSAATERLKRLGEKIRWSASVPLSLDDERRPMTELAQRLASPLNRLVPPSAAEAKKLQKQLMQAGFDRRGASDLIAPFRFSRWLVSPRWLRSLAR